MRWIIVGAGVSGCTAARLLADAGFEAELYEKRSHIAGNAYDCEDSQGILIHCYGPHIFHTTDRRAYDFFSRFTRWYPLEHRVLARVEGRLLPVPFNLNSLEAYYPVQEARQLTERLLCAFGEGARVPVLTLMESEDPQLRAFGETVFRIIFRHYTAKQWGTDPEKVDRATLERVPVLVSRDNRYFQDPWQGMPLEGYTRLFENMIAHPRIRLTLNWDALDHLRIEGGRVLLDGEALPEDARILYTGSIDRLLGLKEGALPYRTLDFCFTQLRRDSFQEAGVVNYTVDQPFTRITEFKKLTGQAAPGRTTVMREYSRECVDGDEPYYPIPGKESAEQYARYRALLPEQILPLGRLGEYRYYNMDRAALRAMELCAPWTGGDA